MAGALREPISAKLIRRIYAWAAATTDAEAPDEPAAKREALAELVRLRAQIEREKPIMTAQADAAQMAVHRAQAAHTIAVDNANQVRSDHLAAIARNEQAQAVQQHILAKYA